AALRNDDLCWWWASKLACRSRQKAALQHAILRLKSRRTRARLAIGIRRMPARPQHSFRSLVLVASIVLICVFLGVVFGQRIGDDTSSAGIGDLNDSLRDFSQVYELVEQNYAE